LFANTCSKLVCKDGVYHALAKRYLAHAKDEPISGA
jgi:hypothetical protein